MASDFPEKVWASRRGSGRKAGAVVLSLVEPHPPEQYKVEVQPYFSASLVSELVEALEDIEAPKIWQDELDTETAQQVEEKVRSHARAALSKAQSSLGVKG